MKMAIAENHSGSCLCGAVSFRTSGKLRAVVYCHCSQCRKQSGHVFAATAVADTNLDVDGRDHLTWYAASPEAKRGFCSVCGSNLFWKRSGSASTSIMAGSFDTPTGLRPEKHIFVAEKGDYYVIDDGLPQHDRSDRGIGETSA